MVELLVLQSLSVLLQYRKNITGKDYLKWHPGGSLGERTRRGTAMTVKGLITAMVTPMRNGSIDEEAVRGLVERLIQKGVNGIFILGTNGEFHVLSREEK